MQKCSNRGVEAVSHPFSGEKMFLPVTKEEMKERGWDQADFILVTGDAYVDHHSDCWNDMDTGLQF